MTVSATLTADKPSYVAGETIVLTYALAGADSHTVSFSGTVTVDGVTFPAATGSLQIDHVESFGQPAADGIAPATQDSGNPAVWRATAA
ncbi:MAG TPA: hypothetical protein VGL39_27850 [Jatrophihabitantaceae bacterium]|jgi:hypothetical protein